jgi:hypothetical protein
MGGISSTMNWKGYRRKQSWPVLRVSQYLDKLRETTKSSFRKATGGLVN